MFKIIKEVWRNTSFRWHNIVRNFMKGGIVTVILIPGIVASMFYMQYENRAIELENKVKYAIKNGWKSHNGEMYLNTYFSTSTFPLVFNKEEIVSIVSKRVEVHNYRVRATRNNRKVGLYVKPDGREEHRIEAIYSDNIEIDGKTQPTIWLKSENTTIQSDELKKELEQKGYKLPLKE